MFRKRPGGPGVGERRVEVGTRRPGRAAEIQRDLVAVRALGDDHRAGDDLRLSGPGNDIVFSR